MKNRQTGEASFPILGIMFLIFLTLKLAGIGVVATWSWWAVTSPLWGAFLVAIICLLLAALLKKK